MSYKEMLQKRIEDLKLQMSSNLEERQRLQDELNRLIKDEFEEALREEAGGSQQLLQG
jgi:hypothetical protein